VEKHIPFVVENITTVLLQISCWYWQWKNVENRLHFSML